MSACGEILQLPDEKYDFGFDSFDLNSFFGTEVCRRIDTVAAAIYRGLTMESLNDLDLNYTPPPLGPDSNGRPGMESGEPPCRRLRIFTGIVTVRCGTANGCKESDILRLSFSHRLT
ncbi:MAG: hypothetical protein JXL20_07215 [Deltaproteobacteria bacterium]|nr:hypothetical protein [Deltaproteobacteria bacterium]